jgi:hypothetical protein
VESEEDKERRSEGEGALDADLANDFGAVHPQMTSIEDLENLMALK